MKNFYNRSNKSFLIKDMNYLKPGNCVCVIKNKNNGTVRYSSGSVARLPYSKTATPEIKKKYGKNIVYTIYRDNEDIVGYYQNSNFEIKKK